MRIAILTFHRAFNSGAVLQAWALQTVLRSMGHSVEFPSCNNVGNYPFKASVLSIPKDKKGLRWFKSLVGRSLLDLRAYVRRYFKSDAKYFERFRRRFWERNCIASDFSKLYDCIVVGSDQVFNPAISGEWISLFLCEDLSSKIGCVAYAASMGDSMLGKEDMGRLQVALRKFNAVSFREKILDYKTVLDPTLLLPPEEYRRLGINECALHGKAFVFVYTIMATSYELGVARHIAKNTGCKLIIMALHDFIKEDGEIRVLPNPEAFVSYVRNATYVVAASFHGTAFSVNFRKKFVSLRNNVTEKWSRPQALLGSLGLMDRLVNPSISLEDTLVRLTADINNEAYSRLLEMRIDSRNWLAQALKRIKA